MDLSTHEMSVTLQLSSLEMLPQLDMSPSTAQLSVALAFRLLQGHGNGDEALSGAPLGAVVPETTTGVSRFLLVLDTKMYQISPKRTK
jgi:hypothetical protein